MVEEVIVEEFPWAQWDSYHQILFYIHFRKKGNDQSQKYMSASSQEESLAPTLSALQFNLDTPHESVVGITKFYNLLWNLKNVSFNNIVTLNSKFFFSSTYRLIFLWWCSTHRVIFTTTIPFHWGSTTAV